jgi:hypothetical protein
MRNWETELVRTQRPLNAGLFAGALINNVVAQFALIRLRADTQEDKVPDKPSELSNLAKWETVWER